MSIQAVNYEVEDMGRYFKSSKKKYKWTFMLEDKQHMLELEFSYLSGKRRLVLDGRVLHESMMLTSSFQYPFTLEGFALNVIQQGDAFELRINNKVFSHLYTQCKNLVSLPQKKQRASLCTMRKSIIPIKRTTTSILSLRILIPNFPTIITFKTIHKKLIQILNLKTPRTPIPSNKSQVLCNRPKHPPPLGNQEHLKNSNSSVRSQKQPTIHLEILSRFQGFPQAKQSSSNKKVSLMYHIKTEVDLLNLDDDVPQQKSVNPQQQEQLLFDQQQQQKQQQEKTNIPQQTNLFEAFGNGWNQPSQQQQQQIPQQQQTMFQQPTQVSQPFESFNQMGQNTQGFQNQQQQGGFQNSHAFGSDFPQAPQQQQNLNILNLYGNQQPVVGNLAYSAFPQVQQYNQPVPQSQPTPFDLFK